MTDPVHQQLLGHLFGALDDDEQAWVEARLERDEDFRRQCLDWRRRLAPLDASRPDFEPPSGLAERTCRLVAGCASVPRFAKPLPPARSPDRALFAGAARGRWINAAVVLLVLAVLGSMAAPAIQHSRNQAKLAECQEQLIQVGQSLAQCGCGHDREAADAENLDSNNSFAFSRLEEELIDSRAVFPEVWLAAQGVLQWSQQASAWLAGFQSPAPASLMLALPSESLFASVNMPYNEQPGMWRNGTINDEAANRPVALAILADAPSANLPGQGRNVFEDGRVVIMPCSYSRDGASPFTGNASFVQPRGLIPVSYNAGPKQD